MFKWFNKYVEKRSEPQSISLSNPNVTEWLRGSRSIEGVSVTPHTVLGVPAVWAGVNIISRFVGSLNCDIFSRVDETGRKTDTSHPAYKLVRHRANPTTSSRNLFADITASAVLHGNGYAYIERDQNGNPTSLTQLDSCNTRADYTVGFLTYKTMIRQGTGFKQLVLLPEDVLHLRGLGWGNGNVDGISVVDIMREALSSSLAMQKHAAKYFDNALFQAGTIEFPDYITKNQEKIGELKQAIRDEYLGLVREKGVMILQNGGKFNPLVINHDQMQFLQSREFDLRLISLIFQLPPHFLASAINSSYGSIEVETLNALSRMNYWLLQLEDELTEKLLTERQKENNTHFIEFNREQAVQMDAMTKINALVTQRNNGLLTTNQAKAKLNEQPLGPEGDVTYIPGNLVPIDQPDGTQDVQDSSSPTELQLQLDATAGQGGPQETAAPATATADVQGTALNGAQIASLLTIVQSVADGLLPQETAAGVIKASFPTLNDAQVAAMLKPLETFEPDKPQQPEPPVAPQDGGQPDGNTQPQPDTTN